MAAGIGSGRDLDAGSECPLQALDVVLFELLRSFANMRHRRFAVEIVDRESRHKEDPALRHHIDQFRLFAEVTTMLDRIDAGFDRGTQPAAAERVTHDASVEHGCYLGE